MTGKLWLAAALIGQAAASVPAPAPGHACPTCGQMVKSSTLFWLVVGFVGQAVFTARFLAQWVASEKQRDSVIPVVFWWLSLVGGMLLLSYAISNRDPVIILGQSMGVFIYVRNLMLVAKGKRRAARARERAEAAAASAPPPIPPRPHLADTPAHLDASAA